MAAEPEARAPHAAGNGGATPDTDELRSQVAQLQQRVQQAEERRRALINIMGDLRFQSPAGRPAQGDAASSPTTRMTEAGLRQTERLDNSRRALLHILKDSHESNLRLGDSRKAMIHIMDDLQTAQELRDKQEQLVQAEARDAGRVDDRGRP